MTPPTEDLLSPDDVAELVRCFYRDVAQDDLLGPLFNDIAGVDWPSHLSKVTAFWCRYLFGRSNYSGNPFQRHASVHDKSPFTPAHFHRWLDMFYETVDAGWVGPNADAIKSVARSVGLVHSGQLLGEAINVSRY